MNRLVVGALTATLIAGSAAAQVPPLAYNAKIFTAVDTVSVQNTTVLVTGIVQGEAAPSTWAVRAYSSTEATAWAAICQRSALLAMSKPGQYLLEIQYLSSTYGGSVCKLSRVTP